jgi:hypothetical protein
MNKSKFLKKSLAMVLAIMMVVAMIPLSASAAAPAVSYVTVNGVKAEGSGQTFTANVSSAATDAVNIEIVLVDGAGMILYDGEEVEPANGVFPITVDMADLTDNTVTFSVFDSEGNNQKDYTVKLTVVAASNDTTLKTFKIDGQYGATVIDNAANTITLTVPYGYAGDKEPVMETTSDKANATFNGGTYLQIADDQTVTVEAESGATRTYTVIVKTAEGFTKFTVPTQIGETEIDEENKEITVNVPFGTEEDEDKEGYYSFIPTFTTGYASVKVTYDDPTTGDDDTNKTVVKSGETKVYVAEGDTSATFTLTYTGVGATEDWTINYAIPAADPVPAIKALSVGNFVATIDGQNISLELPKDVRATGTTMKIDVSTGTEVSVVGTTITNSTETELTSTAGWFKDGKNSFTLRVTAAGPNVDGDTETKDYYLTIKTAEAKPAQINTMVLEDKDGKQYEANINQSTGVISFTVPFAVKTATDLTDWKLFYSLSNGAVMTTTADISTTGSKLAGTESFIPAPGDDGAFDGKVKGANIVVETEDVSSKTYNVVIARSAASTAHSLTGFKLTSEDTIKDMLDTNTFKGSISSSAVNVTVPAKDYEAMAEGTAYALAEVSENAKLFYVDASGKLQTLTANPDEDTTTMIALPAIDSFNGEKDDDGKAKTLTLVVVSEGVDVVANSTEYDAVFKAQNGKYVSEYKLTAKKAAARNSVTIKTFELYNKATDVTVKGTVDLKNFAVNVTVPYGFANPAAGVDNEIYAIYTVAGGETVEYTTGTPLVGYVENEDGDMVGTPSEFTITAPADLKNNANVSIGGTPTTAFTVTSENGSNVQGYALNVKVDAAEQGADMTAVKINNVSGKPDANNKVNLTLPYGTEITSLIPTFTVSKNATVYAGKGTTTVVTADMAFNFTEGQYFTVVSEDKANTSTYYVTVDTADQFTDVDTDDWFYNDVMTAAGKGWITGTGNGNFSPANGMKRGDFALMITRVINADLSAYEGETAFPDIPADKYYAAAVAYCVDKGYLSGYEDGKFYGERTIDRNGMAKVICEVKGLDQVTSTANPFADDAKIPTWAKGYVYACAEAGIILGDTNNNFNGSKIAKRCEAAAVLVRAFA